MSKVLLYEYLEFQNEKRERMGVGHLFEEIIVEIFPDLIEDMNLQWTPSSINSETYSSRFGENQR